MPRNLHECDRTKVLIFDWDDTICPSSFVDRWGIENVKDLPKHFQILFAELGRCAERCLEMASRYGEVIIITNSDDGWVKFSAERYVPNLVPVVAKYRVVSARTRYERFYPSQPLCWKAAAFAHEVNEIYEMYGNDSGDDVFQESCGSMESTDISSDESMDGSVEKIASRKPRQIISFGDSMEERTAVRIVSGQLAATPKSVMFVQTPTPLQLIGQLQMLTSHMKFVCENESSLDLEITPHQAERCAESYLKKHKILFDHHTMGHNPRIRRTGSGTSEVVALSSSGSHNRVD